ncbi:hypothetical protein GPJ61_24900 [Brevibacillus formosus]|nr:hypothetical protein [Brevibacillus formosus]
MKETENKIAQDVEALVMMPTERLATIAWETGMYAAAIVVAAGIRSKDIFLSLLLYNKNNFINLYHNNFELREEELF